MIDKRNEFQVLLRSVCKRNLCLEFLIKAITELISAVFNCESTYSDIISLLKPGHNVGECIRCCIIIDLKYWEIEKREKSADEICRWRIMNG